MIDTYLVLIGLSLLYKLYNNNNNKKYLKENFIELKLLFIAFIVLFSLVDIFILLEKFAFSHPPPSNLDLEAYRLINTKLPGQLT